MRKIVIDGKEYEDFSVGADPEMRIKGLDARPYLPYHGKFGTDGPRSRIAELRPAPHHCPLDLTYEIQNVLRDGWRRFKNIRKHDWLAGTFQEGNPLGGHIHFESSFQKDLELKLDALDRMLAPVIMMLEEAEDSAQRRQGTQYGKLALNSAGKADEQRRGFHLQPSYGGFEYRPLGSWLTSKQLTAGALCLGKVIVFEAHNQGLKDRVAKTIKYIDRDAKFEDAYMSCDKIYMASRIPTIARIVKNFTLYPKYERYINYLFHLIEQGRTWNSRLDMKARWNIVPVEVAEKDRKLLVPEKVSISEAWDKLAGPQPDPAEDMNGFIRTGIARAAKAVRSDAPKKSPRAFGGIVSGRTPRGLKEPSQAKNPYLEAFKAAVPEAFTQRPVFDEWPVALAPSWALAEEEPQKAKEIEEDGPF